MKKIALALFATLITTTAASAGVIALDIQRRDNVYGSLPHKRTLGKRTVTGDLTSYVSTLYYINFTIGTPPQNMAAWLGTATGDLWVPNIASDLCVARGNPCAGLGGFIPDSSSSYSVIEQNTFVIQYKDNSQYTGDYGQDTVQIAGQTIDDMTFGLVNDGTNDILVNGIAGIMGIGYDADETIVSNGSQPYPNLIDRLVSSGAIDAPVYSIYLNDKNSGSGQILFGGIDEAKYEGDLGLVPVQIDETTKAYDTFRIVLSALDFHDGNAKSSIDIGGNLAVIPDPGTSYTFLPNTVVQEIYNGLGLNVSNVTGAAVIPCDFDASGMKFTFTFGGGDGVPVDVDVDQFIIPFPPGSQLDFDTSKYCTFSIYPENSDGLDGYLLGDSFLRSVYAFYDLANNQVGLARAKFNSTDSNIKNVASGGSVPDAATLTNAATLTSTGAAATVSLPTVTGTGAAPTFKFGTAGSNPSATASGTAASGGGGKKLTNPAIIGLSVGLGCAALIIAGVLIFWFTRRRKRRSKLYYPPTFASYQQGQGEMSHPPRQSLPVAAGKPMGPQPVTELYSGHGTAQLPGNHEEAELDAGNLRPGIIH